LSVRYLKLFAALIFVLTLSAPAARAADEVVMMGPPWPPPVSSMTAEDMPPTPAIPPDYPEDFSQPDAPVKTTVHAAFGEDETESVSTSTTSPEAATLKP
jgi:hypothetical protein